MDFTSRNTQPAPSFRPAASSEPASTPNGDGAKKKFNNRYGASKWARWGSIGLLLCVVALVVALILLIAFNKTDSESKYVASDKYQAVFLTSGQVYFGHLTSVTDKYLNLQDIYYLQSNSSTQGSNSSNSNSNLTLVKLGCQQLHDPYDQMIINGSQVSFWENLQDQGQVAKAIANYQKTNPNGQCTDQSQAGGAQGGVQNPSSTGTNPAAPSDNTKK